MGQQLTRSDRPATSGLLLDYSLIAGQQTAQIDATLNCQLVLHSQAYISKSHPSNDQQVLDIPNLSSSLLIKGPV